MEARRKGEGGRFEGGNSLPGSQLRKWATALAIFSSSQTWTSPEGAPARRAAAFFVGLFSAGGLAARFRLGFPAATAVSLSSAPLLLAVGFSGKAEAALTGLAVIDLVGAFLTRLLLLGTGFSSLASVWGVSTVPSPLLHRNYPI